MSQDRQFFETVFGPFAEDLWIKRRLDLEPVIRRLEDVTNNSGSDLAMKNSALEWLRFIRFLADECNGSEFRDDQQWSELMNLMEISRIYNHRSVKFKELLKNRAIILSNASRIRQLNHLGRLLSSIDQSIEKLATFLEECHLDMSGIMLNDSVNYVGLCERISECERYLNNRCKPILYSVKQELDNEFLLRNYSTNLEEWRDSLGKHEASIKLLCQFLFNFRQLQETLVRLKPFVDEMRERKEEKKSDEKNKNQMFQTNLNACKTKFSSVMESNRVELLASLFSLAQGSRKSVTKKQHTSNKSRTEKQSSLKIELVKKLLKKSSKGYCNYSSDLFGDRLKSWLIGARECENQLNGMLQNLRLEFGRFYFINDLELLTIIALDWRFITSEGEKIKPLVSKLFNNSVRGFVLDSEKENIIAIKSPSDEVVELVEGVQLRKKVNIYSVEIVRILNDLLRKLRRSLRHLLEVNYGQNRDLDEVEKDTKVPIQIMILISQLHYTSKVEKCFQSDGDLKELIDHYEKRFLESTKRFDGSTRTLRQSAILSMCVHFMSTLMRLRDRQVRKQSDWNWYKSARYYMVRNSSAKNSHEYDWKIEVRLGNAKFNYKFDYLPIETTTGQSSSNDHEKQFKRLICTDTSEKCFLTASQAISRLRMGASPFGPAGSGKTETVKWLGQSVGCLVIVHNCDETNDFRSLERLVWGLAHTGLWGCFDEFNRLRSGTLSSLSSTLETLQSSLRYGKTSIELPDGEMKSLDEDSAFFITLNPVDEKHRYRGRRQLPANLRSLFLPVSMVQVQVETIARELLLILLAEDNQLARVGFEQVANVGGKLSHWMELMRTSEPKIKPVNGVVCEWDLRLVMVLLKRIKMKLRHAPGAESEKLDLEALVVESIMDELGARLGPREAELRDCLNNSMCQVFNSKQSPFFQTITENADRSTLSSQLVAQLRNRAGVIVVGPTGSGKSWTWRRAAEENSIKWFAVNPKSCSKVELFGEFQQIESSAEGNDSEKRAQKWQDGVLTKSIRDSIEILTHDSGAKQVWIVLDGSIDPDWVECLNSVLDDNQVLTLSSGERLNLVQNGKSVKLIFETGETTNASPATISRLGLLNLNGFNETPLKNQNMTVEDGEILRTFLEQPERQLLILKDADNLLNRDNSRGMLTKDNESIKFIDYYCFAGTNSVHLVELLESLNLSEKTCLILRNVDRIGPEDSWGTRTFLELIRFVLTYGFYFDKNLKRVNIERGNLMLVITTQVGFEQGDPRLFSLAKLASIGPPESASLQSEYIEKVTDLSDIEGVSTVFVTDIRETPSLMDQMEQTAKENVLRFNSSVSTKLSMEVLSKEMDSNAATDRLVILISHRELEYMLAHHRNQLLHWVNMLRIRKTVQFKVIFFTNQHLQQHDSEICLLRMSECTGRVLELRTSGIDHSCETLRQGIGIKFDESLRGWFENKLSRLHNEGLLVGSPENEIGFLRALHEIVSKSEQNLHSQIEILTNGLTNLESFEAEIKLLKKENELEDKELSSKQQSIEKMLDEINMQLRNSKEQEKQIEQLESLQREKIFEIEGKAIKINEELKGVRRLVEKSKSEISQCLKVELLNEIKSLRQPPKVVKDILGVLLVVFGQYDNSWTSIKSFLTKYSLKDELSSFDFDSRLNETVLRKVDEEVQLKGDSFKEEQARRASNAVLPILKWIQATRQYGSVLMKMKPLKEDQVRLEKEGKQLESCRKELEAKQRTIKEKIEKDQQDLTALQAEFKRAEIQVQRIRNDIDKAQQVCFDSADQIDRWKSKLRLFKLLIEGKKLLQLCLLATYIATEHESLSLCTRPEEQRLIGNSKTIDKVLNILDFDREQIEDGKVQIFANILNLFESQSSPSENLLKFLPEETGDGRQSETTIDLLILRLNLFFGSSNGSVPLISVDKQSTYDVIIDNISSRRIARDSVQDFKLIAPSLCQSECVKPWRTEADFSAKLGKTLLFDLRNFEPFSPTWIDVIEYQRHQLTSGATKIEMILMANLHDYAPEVAAKMKDLLQLRLVDCSQSTRNSSNSSSNIESRLKVILSELENAEFGSMIRKLETELHEKQLQGKKMEDELINRLSRELRVGKIGSEGLNGDEQSTKNPDSAVLENQLVVALSEMHRLCQGLEEDVSNIKRQIQELRRRQTQYNASSKEASIVYLEICETLKKIGSTDRFFELYLEDLGRILIKKKLVLDLELVLTKVMQPLDLRSRELFREEFSLRSSHRSGDLPQIISQASRRAANLSENLFAQLEELIQDDQRNFRLAVLLHDSRKSSPQMEVDEIFGKQWLMDKLQQSVKCQVEYLKLYAHEETSSSKMDNTRNNKSDLYAELSSLLTSKLRKPAIQKLVGDEDSGRAIKCVSIANAHMAAEPLSAIERVSSDLRPAGEKILFILVGECDRNHVDCNPMFDTNLLSNTSLKYWHDELFLKLIDRFNSMKGRLEDVRKTRAATGLDRDQEILEQLILFHVVAQEVSKDKGAGGMKVRWHHDSYSFDFEQLRLAVDLFESLVGEQLDQPLAMFCSYLESFIYGSRMESKQDEDFLKRLIHMLIRDVRGSRQMLTKLKSGSDITAEINQALDSFPSEKV